MFVHSRVAKVLGRGAILTLVVVTVAGYAGCSDSPDPCGEGSNCAASEATGSSGSGSGGEGGAGQGGSGGQAGGGPQVCDPSVSLCGCDSFGKCQEGAQCIDGLCLPGCSFSYECSSGKVCADGKCTISCGPNTPCMQAGTTCDKGICIPDPNNPACDAQTPCPDADHVCVGGVCQTTCQVNANCATGEVCNYTTGTCIVDPATKPKCDVVPCGGVGQECMMDGYCHYGCIDANECQLIDNRFTACDEGFCKTDEEANPECTLSNPCPNGLSCISNKCL